MVWFSVGRPFGPLGIFGLLGLTWFFPQVIGKRVQMLHDIGFTDLWLPPCSQSVAPQAWHMKSSGIERLAG